MYFELQCGNRLNLEKRWNSLKSKRAEDTLNIPEITEIRKIVSASSVDFYLIEEIFHKILTCYFDKSIDDPAQSIENLSTIHNQDKRVSALMNNDVIDLTEDCDDEVHGESLSDWTCSICTLINSRLASKCDACDSERPINAKIEVNAPCMTTTKQLDKRERVVSSIDSTEVTGKSKITGKKRKRVGAVESFSQTSLCHTFWK